MLLLKWYIAEIDNHGNFSHQNVATHALHAEAEYFDVHEYPDYLDVVDDILDAHNPDLVNL
jgi:hypothetical protein